MRIIFKYFLLAIFVLPCWMGCASQDGRFEVQKLNPEVARSMEIARLSADLEKSGARVVQVGETIRIILSSDWLFNPASANFSPSSSRALNDLAQLMLITETTSVEVNGYTDIKQNTLQNKALATGQAEAVLDYLGSRGVDARVIYARGYSVRSNPQSGQFASGANRRVEIRFQYLPLLSSLVD